ncbi:MFS transporter [Desulfatitalea alkaliphila]|uniref:MFS transporter n=1 Tax=Desulfatitalea alkaliphila TaxID=2929485 RepID=A0AA41UJZ8_9BACT|nr:MFS transporter [Desulfatitalea alkaliphila]MCJ8499846.1 MFS transporter [Desulfatitalea alkaliphila]
MNVYDKADIKVLFALTLVHFTGDFYSSFTNPLFPLFVEKLGLSLTQIGIIAGLNRLLAFIVQPSAGYLADRYQSRAFIFWGLLLPVVFIPLSGLAPGFWTLLIVIALGSIGSSMFHPSVTGMVPLYSGSNSGFAMSVFNTGGTLAFGLGPLFITWYAVRFSLAAVPLTMLMGLCVCIYLFFVVPIPQSEGFRHLGFFRSIKESLGNVWKSVFLIWLVMVLRAITGQSFLTFMPVLYVQKGFSLVSAGGIFALFTVAGTVSGLGAGLLSDRIGYKPVFLFFHFLMTPMLLLFLRLEGHWVYLGAILAGGSVLATMPIGVAMAQTLAPRGRSMVASLMMGLAFGLGGLVSPLVGRLADLYSIYAVLNAAAWLPLLTLPLIVAFPRVKQG